MWPLISYLTKNVSGIISAWQCLLSVVGAEEAQPIFGPDKIKIKQKISFIISILETLDEYYMSTNAILDHICYPHLFSKS